MKLIQSTGEFRDRKFTDVNQLNEEYAGKTIWVRGKYKNIHETFFFVI